MAQGSLPKPWSLSYRFVYLIFYTRLGKVTVLRRMVSILRSNYKADDRHRHIMPVLPDASSHFA